MQTTTRSLPVFFAMLAGLAGTPLLAQTFGEITGHLSDASGASVPGAKVTLTNTATFDPKTSNNGVFADAAAFNKKIKVLFLGIGSVEGTGTKNFSEALTAAGIKNAYFESPGTAHEWLTWRRCLYDFAPRLFK